MAQIQLLGDTLTYEGLDEKDIPTAAPGISLPPKTKIVIDNDPTTINFGGDYLLAHPFYFPFGDEELFGGYIRQADLDELALCALGILD